MKTQAPKCAPFVACVGRSVAGDPRRGAPCVYRGSDFVAEAMSDEGAYKIADALNKAGLSYEGVKEACAVVQKFGRFPQSSTIAEKLAKAIGQEAK